MQLAVPAKVDNCLCQDLGRRKLVRLQRAHFGGVKAVFRLCVPACCAQFDRSGASNFGYGCADHLCRAAVQRLSQDRADSHRPLCSSFPYRARFHEKVRLQGFVFLSWGQC